jgi:hypothetical protein
MRYMEELANELSGANIDSSKIVIKQFEVRIVLLMKTEYKPILSNIPHKLLQRKKGANRFNGDDYAQKPCQGMSNNYNTIANIPHAVQDILRSPGRRLSESSLTLMESRFGCDFSQVRVHTDTQAGESAQRMNALAYTVGNDVVFKAGQYCPDTNGGLRLLAHELTHVVQQCRGSGENDAEMRAQQASERIVRGESVAPELTGNATPGFHAQEDNESRPRRSLLTERAFQLDWPTLSQFGLSPLSPFPMQPNYQLTPPSLGTSSSLGYNLGSPSLSPSPLTMRGLTPPMGFQPRQPWLIPPLRPAQSNSVAPEAPSRIPLYSSGQFSLGLRLGFPELKTIDLSGAPPSALQESMQRAKIMSQILSGKVPTGWEAVDKSKLASAIWGIFSTNIAPDLARRISSSLSTPTGPGRTSYQLDFVILGDFSGGGLSLSVRYFGL